jgi:hypothetical protein
MVDVEEDNDTYCSSDACRHKGDNNVLLASLLLLVSTHCQKSNRLHT